MKIKNLIFGVFMLLFVAVFCYVAGEAVVYIAFREEVPCFPRFVTGMDYNGWQIRQNVPDSEYQHKSYDGKWQFQVNSQGYRSDREFPYKKESDVLRVMTIGDSYTMGFEVQQDETYASVIEKTLNEEGIKTEVINAGVSGFSNAEQLVYYEQEGVKFYPDVLILGFYLNDFNDNLRADLFRFENGELLVNRKVYQPAIKQRDFLNSFWLYRWLSQHSYLHNFLNFRATAFFKQLKLKEKKAIENQAIDAGTGSASKNQEQLAYAILKRIYEIAQENGTHFIVLDITKPSLEGASLGVNAAELGLCDQYYNSLSDMVSLKEKQFIHRPHGSRHWTEHAHKVAGERLAEYIFSKINKPKNVPEQVADSTLISQD